MRGYLERNRTGWSVAVQTIFAYLDTVRLTGPDNYLIRTRSATRVVSQS